MSEPARLQPLRIPGGWRIGLNKLFAVDPTEENVRLGFFGGSSLFTAIHEGCRLLLDLEWQPIDDPTGQYRLTVHNAPWPRTPAGRRQKGAPVVFAGARLVHEFQTRDRGEMLRELESALTPRPEWIEHN